MISAPDPPASTPYRLLLKLSLAERGRHATSIRHRLALFVAAALIGMEAISVFLGTSNHDEVAGTLRNVGWCAVWSLSGTLLDAHQTPSFLGLLTLRGIVHSLRRSLQPLAQALLAFTLVGSASATLGVCLLARAESISAAARGLIVLSGLVLLSALFACGLALLCSLANVVKARRASMVFLGFVIVPALLGPALYELPSVMGLFSNYAELLLKTTSLG